MSIRTQAEALDALTATTARIESLTATYSSGGAAIQARAARQLSDTFRDRAAIYRLLPKLYSGRRPTRWLATLSSADAAMANDMLTETWRLRSDAHQAEADRIERQALPAFGDGMEYVPGRGRIRAVSPVTGESNRKRFTALDGGQR